MCKQVDKSIFKFLKIPYGVFNRVVSLSAELSCSFHVSPLSLLRIMISLSLLRIDAKCGISIKTGLK